MPNYYEVLGVQKDCSTNDVKDAYILLCKKLHPDSKPGDEAQHKNFIILNEAYTVLVKPETRYSYDCSLRNLENASKGHSNSRAAYDDTININMEYERSKVIFKGGKRFYGNTYSRRRVPWIAAGCVLAMGIGTVIQLFILKAGFTFSRKRLDEKDESLAQLYYSVRKEAKSRTKEENIERLMQAFNESRGTKGEDK